MVGVRHTVFITGAAGGLGAATAEEFAKHGWEVFAADLVAPAAASQRIPITLDVTDSDSCAAAARGWRHTRSGRSSILRVCWIWAR